jgi:dihydrofolate synthase/folylpolyglutamate synthase
VQYIQALQFLQRRDDWERSGSPADADRWDLRRMRSLLARLGDPHLGRRTVHVAGSKGKGGVAAMAAAVLRKAGLRTGLYTSPHLHRFVERIAIDGEPVAPEDFGRLMGELRPQIEAEDADGRYGTISTFEALTALAFLAFREHGVEAQVLEVGLGGRLDATNVFDTKDVCVITPVSLEHTAVLGDTIGQIASEKAGIITPGATVIMAPQRESAADVVRAVCAELGAELIEVAQACALSRTKHDRDGQEFSLRTPRTTHKLRLPLLGRHQLDNAAAAVLAVEALGIEIDEAALHDGLAAVKWPCRIEILKHRPLVVADGSHNRDSARRLVQTLRDDLGVREAVLVIGCSGDKDLGALAEELAPLATHVITTRSRHPRSQDARAVAQAFSERELPVAVEEPVGAAVDAALAQAAGAAVVICGSLFVAAEAREHVLGVAYDPPLRKESQVGA